MDSKIERFVFEPNGGVPNNSLPLLFYPQVLTPALRTPSAAQALFRENDWLGNWVDGIFDYWHFHVTGHEVLGCVAGEAEVGFGGDGGVEVTFRAGTLSRSRPGSATSGSRKSAAGSPWSAGIRPPRAGGSPGRANIRSQRQSA